jgi:hypothetical protein
MAKGSTKLQEIAGDNPFSFAKLIPSAARSPVPPRLG